MTNLSSLPSFLCCSWRLSCCPPGKRLQTCDQIFGFTWNLLSLQVNLCSPQLTCVPQVFHLPNEVRKVKPWWWSDPLSHLGFRLTALSILEELWFKLLTLFSVIFPHFNGRVIKRSNCLSFLLVSPRAVSLNQSVKLIINQSCSLTSLFLMQAPLKACVSRSITSLRTLTTRRTLPSISYVSPILPLGQMLKLSFASLLHTLPAQLHTGDHIFFNVKKSVSQAR